MKRRVFLLVLVAAGLLRPVPSSAQGPEDGFGVRVRILTSEKRGDGSSYVLRYAGYIDGTPAQLRCSQCSLLQSGDYWGRWDKDKLKIRSRETFGKHRTFEDKFEVSLSGPKRDTSWSREKPVLITAYGVTEEECLLPIRLAQNVIGRIEHPADWRVVIACTPQAWESASLAFGAIGGTRVAFTLWDNPRVPAGGVALTVLNAEQFDHCMRPGCYVHTILHELGHFRRVSGNEMVADTDATQHEQALYREHAASEFLSIQDLKKCAATPDCPGSDDMKRLAALYRPASAQPASAQPASSAPARSPQEAADLLQRETNPADTDPAHFPLVVTLLDVQWQTEAAGGAAGTGRGDVVNGVSIVAIDFNALCPTQLTASAAGNSYRARWDPEPNRLLLVSKNAQTQATHVCELNTAAHPDRVYVRNAANGAVAAFTQEQFKAIAAEVRARGAQTSTVTGATGATGITGATAGAKAAQPRLTNADVISMVTSNLSSTVIQAKIAASDCAFDTSPEALRELKAAHVPDEIVLEMIKRTTR